MVFIVIGKRATKGIEVSRLVGDIVTETRDILVLLVELDLPRGNNKLHVAFAVFHMQKRSSFYACYTLAASARLINCSVFIAASVIRVPGPKIAPQLWLSVSKKS